MSSKKQQGIAFHASLSERFVEIEHNCGRKKIHRTNQGTSCLKGSLSNRDNLRSQIQFRKRISIPASFKDASIFTSIVGELHEESNETSWDFPALKLTSYVQFQFNFVSTIKFNFRSQLRLLQQITTMITFGVKTGTISVDNNTRRQH